jgi:hypothetical protein
MIIALYLDNRDATSRKVWEALEMTDLCNNADLYTNMKDFVNIVDKPIDPSTIVIIPVIDYDHLQKLTNIRESLYRFRLLLVLPEGSRELMNLGHTFRPRVLLHAGDISPNLIPVLRKMKQMSEMARATSSAA